MSRYIFSALLVVCLMGVISAHKNNYVWGTHSTKDVLLAREMVTRSGFFGVVTTYDYVYKADSLTPPKISYIKITDAKPFGGATATISTGGLNTEAVSILFTSQRGFGIKSFVEIYGTPN
ncbi:probable salivary secreted peptide [Calliphora vicina]|uniref:probable salivary secreted peptide n=1 Tax=Calliphora vicina TaxID=7373 RepID=UPI00325C1AF4